MVSFLDFIEHIFLHCKSGAIQRAVLRFVACRNCFMCAALADTFFNNERWNYAAFCEAFAYLEYRPCKDPGVGRG